MTELNGSDSVPETAPQAQLPRDDLVGNGNVDTDANGNIDDVDRDNYDDDEEETKSWFRFCKLIGGCYYRIIAAWPRTSALTFGVVVPLFILIAVSVFFGYFLAQLEGPGEIDYNNDVISTRVALALQEQLVGNITMNLPHICACTYLTDKKYQNRFDEQMQKYEQCLEEQRLQKMPSSSPSFQPTTQLSFKPNVTLNGANNSTNVSSIIESSNSTGSNNETESDKPANTEPIVCVEPTSLQKNAIEYAIQRVFISQFKPCLSLDIKPTLSTNPFGDGTVCTETGMVTSFEDIGVSTEDLLTEMKTCGNEALDIAEDYKLSSVITMGLADASPSWNWNRCALRNGEDDLGQKAKMNLNQLLNPWVNVSYLKPTRLEEEAVDAWMESQQELYCQYVEDGLAEGKSLSNARYDALEKSFADANGFEDEDCHPNMWAGAWFWFTIMTTIGYGNTAPATDGGRIMIFTLGFVSILLFGVVLGKAGSIVVAIVEDFLLRTHLPFLTRNWIQMIIWGGLYYLWSLLIAFCYVAWNEMRLGETVTLKDAYWYAYITTTTVGLGDYYLEHAAIIGIDLLIWPLLILYGFVLLAAFLTALGAFVQAADDGSDFADKLAAEQSLFSCFPKWLQRDAEFEASIPPQSFRNTKKSRTDQNGVNPTVDAVANEADDAIPVINNVETMMVGSIEQN